MSAPAPLPARWAEVPRTAFAALPAHAVAVLPLGATEQHGDHLPTGVDTLLTEAVLDRALRLLPHGAPVLALPILSVTKSNEHAAWPGVLALSAGTLMSVLHDMAASVAQAGVRRLVLLNGHGGNGALLEVAARDIRAAHGLVTAHASWFAFADLAPWPAEALAHDLHAGDLETSAMLAVRPDLVDMGRAQAGRVAPLGEGFGLSGPLRPGWLVPDLAPGGVMGDATAATAAKGQALVDSAARGLARALAAFCTPDFGKVAP